MRGWLASVLWLVMFTMATGAGAQVQGQSAVPARSPILIIDTERLFKDSAFGRRVAEEVEAESALLAAENQRIMADLTAEESDLTQRRPGMEPEAFRTLANAFDERAQTIRREQRQKLLNLQQKQETGQALFFATAQPVLQSLMREAGASVILERGTTVLFLPSSDVTDQAIQRVDAALGRGPETLPIRGSQDGRDPDNR